MTLVSPAFFLKNRPYLLFSIETAIYTSAPPPLTYINITPFFILTKTSFSYPEINPGMRRTYIARMEINGH